MIGALSPFTQRAIERLRTGRAGDQITVAEMSQIVGRDCSQTNGGANVRTAIRHVRREYRVWWERIRGEGLWRCLGDAEKVESQNRSVRLLAKRGRLHARESIAIAPEKLDANSKVDFYLNQIQFGLILTAGGSAMRKRLVETKTLEDLQTPEPPKLIELMSDGTRASEKDEKTGRDPT